MKNLHLNLNSNQIFSNSHKIIGQLAVAFVSEIHILRITAVNSASPAARHCLSMDFFALMVQLILLKTLRSASNLILKY